jgi:hypothetical protein
MNKYLSALTLVFISVFFVVPHAYAFNTCYAPVPVDCTTLSSDACSLAHTQYESESAIYNSCIASNYSVDIQNSANQARIRSYCNGSGDVQACTDGYNACQVSAPTNGFGQPGSTNGCTYTCNTGYYMTISNTCAAQSKPTPPVVVVPVTPQPPATTVITPVIIPATTITTVTTSATPSLVVPPTPVVHLAVPVVSKSKNFFSQIVQSVTPKPTKVTPVIMASTSANENTNVPEPVNPAPPASSQPISFWARVGHFLSRLNPLTWF